MNTYKGGKSIPGVALSSVRAPVYQNKDRDDLVIIAFEPGSVGAAVTTTNQFCAAPVHRLRAHLEMSKQVRYWLLNSGNANAGTGLEGLSACDETMRVLAKLSGCKVTEIWPFSTGVIGELLPTNQIAAAIPAAFDGLCSDRSAWERASKAIMTTDTQPKLRHISIELDGIPVTLSGMAKGSGMIHPNLATMFGLIASDINISPDCLQAMLSRAVSHSFNCVTIDGDTSTNDACAVVATRQAKHSMISDLDSKQGQVFQEALSELCDDLAEMLARDGEGAGKFVRVVCEGASSPEDAHVIANTVALSPLVKTALAASDPNWGRILAAIGRAPVGQIDVSSVNIWLNNVHIVAGGARHPNYTEDAGRAAMAPTDVEIRISMGQGAGSSRVMTCDFTSKYVQINAEYRS